MIFEKKNKSRSRNQYILVLVIAIVVIHVALSCMHAGTMWISIHPEKRVDMNPAAFVLHNVLHPSEEHVTALLIASMIMAGAMYCNKHWSKSVRMFGRSLSFASVYYVVWSIVRVVAWLFHPDMMRDVGHVMAVMYFYLLHPSMMQLLLSMVIIIVSAFLIYDKGD